MTDAALPHLVGRLVAGRYVGSGDGQESGPFTAQIDVADLPGGGISLDYLASAPDGTTLHAEHTLVTLGLDGRERLTIAHTESPVLTELVAEAPGSSRYVQTHPSGPFAMEIEASIPAPPQLSYAWRWAPVGEPPVEQSRAVVTLMPPR